MQFLIVILLAPWTVMVLLSCYKYDRRRRKQVAVLLKRYIDKSCLMDTTQKPYGVYLRNHTH